MARKADEKFEMTSEELERLHEAMKKEEFRKLLVEYAEEISNPENRKKYEEEIAMLESERGVDVRFIHPHPVYVLRTCADGAKKAFINVAQNEAIERASLDRASGGGGGARGVHWNIPHSFAPPREDRDKSGAMCSVFDVVFHPDTLRMAQSNAAFKRAIDSTALEGIERQFGVQLDRSNVKTMRKLKFKGKPAATIIRKTRENFATPAPSGDSERDDPLGRLPYPYGAPSSGAGGGDGTPPAPREQRQQEREQSSEPSKSKAAASGGGDDERYAVPKHTIVNRYHADMTDFATNLASPAAGNSRPRALVVEVSLPLLSSAAGVTLDVLDRKLSLKSDAPARYKLDLALPYPVDDAAGSAKFDKRKKCLVVTLPVLPAKPQAPIDLSPMPPPLASCGNDTGTTTDDVSPGNDRTQIDASGSTIDADRGGESLPQQWPAGDARHTVGEAAASVACCNSRAAPAAVCSGGSVHTDCNIADACGSVSSSQDGDKGAAEAGTAASAAAPADLASSHNKSGSGDASLLPVALPDEGASVDSSGGSSCGDGRASVDAPDAGAIKYMMPQFSYDQDDLRVTFVIDVKNIKADSVRVAFGVDRQAADVAVAPERAGTDASAGCSSSGGCSFVATFCSIGSGYFPMHYSLAVRFPDGCQIVGDECAVDVSVRNAVLIFRKASSSTWQNFQCAPTTEELAANAGEMREFETMENLQAELNRLEKECAEAKSLDSCQSAAGATSAAAGAGTTAAAARSLYVKSLRDECLSINIKELDFARSEPKSARSTADAAVAAVSASNRCRRHHRDDDEIEDDEDDSALSSPEIIYNKEPPKDLQGILKKQRGDSSSSSSSSGSSCPSDGPDEATLSGATSSDGGLNRSISGGAGGVSSDGGIESPDSSDENGSSALTQRKKAVTFNDHVDETAYQPSAAVTMLHQTLKNKRKRQKKKEDRKQHAATVAEGRRRRRNSSSGSITTDEEEVVAAAVSEATTAAGSQASVGSAVRQRSAQHGRSARISDAVVSSLAADTATPQTVAISETASSGDGTCGINTDRAPILDFDVATSPVDTNCRTAEMAADQSKPAADLSKPAADQSKPAADQSKPAADLSKPAADLSKPAADLSKPAADLSKPAADLSKPAAVTSDPVIGCSADVDRVEIRERGTADLKGAAREGEAGCEIALDHRGTSGASQLVHQSPNSIAGGRLPSQASRAGSGKRRCNAAAADSDDDERDDGAADAFAESLGSSGSPASASVGCRAAVSHNEHATKCSFAFRNSIAYELD